MSTTSPLLQNRAAQPYIVIPLTVSVAELDETLPAAFAELTSWARQHAAPAHGAPFVRYRTTVGDASGRLAVEVGLPVAAGSDERLAVDMAADPRLRDGVLPPGTYATLVHTGSYAGLRAATAQLLAWGEANGVAWHGSDDSRAEHWEAHVESRLTDPAVEPDPAHWQTEIAILTKET